MSSTVSVGGFEITSTDTNAAAMVESLTSPKDDAATPRVLVDEGKPVKAEDADLSKAAAAARKVAPIPDKPEAKPDEDKDEDEGDKAKRAVSEEIDKAPTDQRKRLASERVAEATRAAAEAKRALATERAEKERLAHELREAREGRERPVAPRQERAAPAAVAGDDPEPVADDFEKYEDYVKAQARHAARQEFAAERQRAEGEHARAERVKTITGAMETFHGRVEEAAKADTEFLEKHIPFLESLRPSFMTPREELGPTNVIADEIIKSESAPALIAYLSENPDVFQRLATLRTPRDISIEMRVLSRELAKTDARLEAGATAGTPPPKPDVSRANPPLRPVKGAPPAAEPDIHGDIDFDTFVKRSRARR